MILRGLLKKANTTVLLCDNTKEEAGGFFKLTDFRDIDVLISNGQFSPELDELLEKNITKII